MNRAVLVVTGGRLFTDREFIFRALDDAWGILGFTKLIHGAADGVDKICGEWVGIRNYFAKIEVREVPAEWENLEGVPARYIRTRRDGTRYNVQAGFQRNDIMAKDMGATHGLIFPGGNGTADMAERMIQALGFSKVRDLRGTYRGQRT